ncbi:hypothetical protein BH10BAC5_BH10BAC5_23610 [soil metagenome]
MNKSKLYILSLAICITASLTFYSFINFESSVEVPKYVGAEKCAGACHKSELQGNQFGIWKETKHSQAFNNLITPDADKIAIEKGFTTPASETPECLKCHTSQADVSLVTETFNIKDGVQCETCHGAGSEYKTISIMKDQPKAIENGLIIHTEKEKFCTQCHNSESPTFKSFDYETYWAQIKHMRPVKQ